MAKPPPSPSSGKELMESKAFVDFYSKLTTVFHDKKYLAHFVTAGIISPNDVDEFSKLSDNDRAMSLLKYISAPLECGDKQSFYNMLEIMQTHGKHHAQQLAENIKTVVRGVDTGTSQRAETVVTPSEVSTDATSNVVAINFSDYDDIQAAFLRLTAEVCKLLKKADFSTLRRGMIVAHKNVPKGMQFPDDLYQSIRAAQNLDTLLDLLVDSKHWSWVDLRLLEALIESSGICKAKDLVSKYKDVIFSRKLSDVLKKMFMPQEKKNKDEYTSKVAIKLEKDPNEMTVGDLSEFATQLENVIMDINNGSCVLEHLATGCLEIHWLIPTHCRFHAYKSALNNRHKFCDLHLQYLHIEPYPPVYNLFTIQPTILSDVLHLSKPVASTAAEVIDHYYCFLLDKLDNSEVNKIMLESELLTDKDLAHIPIHSDYQQFRFLLDQLLIAKKASIVGFCHILEDLKNQQELGHMLVNAIKSLPSEPAEVADTVIDRQSSGNAPYEPTSSKEDNTDLDPAYQPEVFLAAKSVHIRFVHLVAQLKQMLKGCDPKSFLVACNKLTASAGGHIPLLGADYLQDLDDDADIKEIFNRLAFLWTWNNHSILRALLEACNCQDGLKMLDDFESKIDATQPMELFPIPPPLMKMAPSLSSPFTVLSVRGEYDRDEPVTLQYVNDVATIMTEKFGISPHALQLLAARANPLMLYWMIPKSVVPLISEGVNEYLDFLKQNGLSEIAIYPNTILFATDNLSHGSFALLNFQSQSDGDTEEVSVLEGTSDDIVIKQVYQQNSDLKADIARLKSSEKNLLNELKLLKEKYSSLEKSRSNAELIMDQLEETKSNFENLPFLKKYKDDEDKELIVQPVESTSDIAKRPPDFLDRMQIFKVEFEKIMKWCESSEANLPAADVKIKQEELHPEPEGAGAMDDLKEKSLNKKDSRITSPSGHANREEQKDSRKTVSSRSSESDSLESQKGKEHIPHPVSKPQESDKGMTMQTESSLDCPICANRFTVKGPHQPRILKCGHTFCTNCIQKTSKMEKKQIKCSFCFGVTPKGALGIYELPVNITLVDILCNMNSQRNLKSETTPVDLCCICNHPAEKICYDCDSAGCKLCEVCCIAEHSRSFPPAQMHKPLNINEANASFCVKHKQLLTHYSETETIFACKECLTELGDEDFHPIEVVIQTLRQRLPKVMENLKSYLRRLQDAQYKMEMIQNELGVTKSKTMQKILKKFNNYQVIFQERENTVIANLEMEVNNRRMCLRLQINKLREITEKVISHKEHLKKLMQKDRQGFLSKYRDTQNEINELLDNEDFGLQRPVALPDLSVYLPDKFESDLRNLGSVGGGPVVNLNAAMHTSGLLQLTWSLPDSSEDIEECEIEYSSWHPLSAEVTSVNCDAKALDYIVHPICPGYTYQFRMRSRSASGWGMWSKSILSQFDDFPRTIGYNARIVTLRIPSTAYYRITAKGAKAADGSHFKGGRGAIISATFQLQKDDVLEILCGGMSERHNCHSGGAGGTFIAVNSRQVLDNILLVAGGGGGTRGFANEDIDGCDASLEPNGTSATMDECAEGGMNGAPGKDAAYFKGPSWGYGGAGWQQSSITAKSFVDGGNGGEYGGFGGGGGVGMYGGGGGGGFSGGGGGRGGGGGGSYVRANGDNVTKEVGHMSHGEVEIVKLVHYT